MGLATSVVNLWLIWAAHLLMSAPTATWLAWGLGAFVLGWIIQFVGHHWEGRKPAFADDLVGLLVGPAFVVGEALFALGLCKPMAAPTRSSVATFSRRSSDRFPPGQRGRTPSSSST